MMIEKLAPNKHIKFREARTSGFSLCWKGRKNGFCFEINLSNKKGNTYYALVNHAKKDIVFNSLWAEITFATIQDAFDWCNTFKSKNFQCLGDDANEN